MQDMRCQKSGVVREKTAPWFGAEQCRGGLPKRIADSGPAIPKSDTVTALNSLQVRSRSTRRVFSRNAQK